MDDGQTGVLFCYGPTNRVASVTDWYVQECIETGQESLIFTAIEAGEMEIESRDCVDRTPLMVAAEFKKPNLVRSLLALGANPSSQSNDGDTCLSVCHRFE